MGKVTFKERERQRREEEILSKAEELLVQRSYASLTMDDLADAVGISKPTLYQHFKSKEELAAQVFLRGFRETETFLNEPWSGSSIDRLIEFIRWSIAKRHASGNTIGGLRPDLIRNVLSTNPDVETYKARLHGRLAELVEQAKMEGDITREVPTPIVLHLIVSLQWAVHNPTIRAEIANNPEGLSGTIDHLLRLFRYGTTPRAEKSNP